MFQLLAAAASSAAGTDDSSVAVIGAIGALLVAVLTALGIYVKGASDRADRLNKERVDDAVTGEAQLRKERDEARAETARVQKECEEATARAYRERDKWMNQSLEDNARANRAEIRVAVLEAKLSTKDQNGDGT